MGACRSARYDASIETNVRLVQSIARKFSVPTHLDRDDLVQDGMIGLERAVEKFDWRRGYKFSTYATWWIRQSVQRGLEQAARRRVERALVKLRPHATPIAA